MFYRVRERAPAPRSCQRRAPGSSADDPRAESFWSPHRLQDPNFRRRWCSSRNRGRVRRSRHHQPAARDRLSEVFPDHAGLKARKRPRVFWRPGGATGSGVSGTRGGNRRRRLLRCAEVYLTADIDWVDARLKSGELAGVCGCTRLFRLGSGQLRTRSAAAIGT